MVPCSSTTTTTESYDAYEEEDAFEYPEEPEEEDEVNTGGGDDEMCKFVACESWLYIYNNVAD